VNQRVLNLTKLIDYINDQDNFDIFYHQYGNQDFFLDISQYDMWNFNTEYKTNFICGLSMIQCVNNLYEMIEVKDKYIVKDCCLQETYTGDKNYDHPNVNNIDELIKFENDWLGGKINFTFFDNSPNNDGTGEWTTGNFKKINYIKFKDIV